MVAAVILIPIQYFEGKSKGRMGIMQLSLQVIRGKTHDIAHGDKYTVSTLKKNKILHYSPVSVLKPRQCNGLLKADQTFRSEKDLCAGKVINNRLK